jgi:hypothetical protein
MMLCGSAFGQLLNYQTQLKNYPTVNTTAPLGGGGTLSSSLTVVLNPCGALQIEQTNAGATGWQCINLSFGNVSGAISLGQTPLTTRGDVLTVNSTPGLARLALGGANLYLKSNGTDTVYSTLAAGGVGSCSSHNWVNALNADAAPTCAQPGGADLASGTQTSQTLVGLGASGTNTLTLTPNHQIFTSNGTLTIGTGVTAVKVTVTGGGGGGAGVSAGATDIANGGTAGGTAIKWLTGLTPANTITVTVGTGGTGGSAGSNNGNAGNNSSISSGTQTISTVTANGGFGGTRGLSGVSGQGGGTASGGDINIGGGGTGPSITATVGGPGGNSIFGGAGSAGAGGGGNGGAPGAGGGGAGNGAAGATAGGNGANGIVIFEWTN